MKQATKKQREFYDLMMKLGCAATGSMGRLQLHHVVGRSYKQNKTPIGHWFVLPLSFPLHDVSSNNPLNVTHHRHAFTDFFGLQSELFLSQINTLKQMREMEIVKFSDEVLPPIEVIDAILSTKK